MLVCLLTSVLGLFGCCLFRGFVALVLVLLLRLFVMVLCYPCAGYGCLLLVMVGSVDWFFKQWLLIVLNWLPDFILSGWVWFCLCDCVSPEFVWLSGSRQFVLYVRWVLAGCGWFGVVLRLICGWLRCVVFVDCFVFAYIAVWV